MRSAEEGFGSVSLEFCERVLPFYTRASCDKTRRAFQKASAGVESLDTVEGRAGGSGGRRFGEPLKEGRAAVV